MRKKIFLILNAYVGREASSKMELNDSINDKGGIANYETKMCEMQTQHINLFGS